MSESVLASFSSTLTGIMVTPSPDELWQIQKELLSVGGELARKARDLAGAFHSCLRSIQSKSASCSASRWAAAFETAAVTSVGLQEMLTEQADPLRRLLATGVTAALEVGAAVKNAEAWAVEASLIYHDVAWYLYGELWEISATIRPELSSEDRRRSLDLLLNPVLDPSVDDTSKAALLVRLFHAALAARVWLVLQSAGVGNPKR